MSYVPLCCHGLSDEVCHSMHAWTAAHSTREEWELCVKLREERDLVVSCRAEIKRLKTAIQQEQLKTRMLSDVDAPAWLRRYKTLVSAADELVVQQEARTRQLIRYKDELDRKVRAYRQMLRVGAR